MEKLHKKYLVNDSGRKTAVVLPLAEYENLLDDLHDLAIIAERKDEPAISFSDLKKKLKIDGLI